MSLYKNDDENIPGDTEVCYEAAASQEEIYLEEVEEEVRAILTSDDQVPSRPKAEYWRRKIEKLELDWEQRDSMTECK